MKLHTRRAIAYIVVHLISKKSADSLYDHTTSKHYPFSNDSTENQVSIFDHSQNCHISGGLPDIYHYGNKAYIFLEITGKEFEGYDYDASCHFEGDVEGNSVSLYDHGDSSSFTYSI